MPEIKEVSDRVIFLSLGQIVACDTPENLKKRFGQQDLEEIFVSIDKEPLSIGLVMRFGPSADILAFFIPFLLLPFSAVCYPVSVFPSLLQKITFILPTRRMFEGMRIAIT